MDDDMQDDWREGFAPPPLVITLSKMYRDRRQDVAQEMEGN